MRRIVLAVTFALLSLFGTGALAPAPVTHASAVPVISVSSTTVVTNTTVTITGTGFSPNCYVYFYYQRPDGTFNSFFVFTSVTGTFSFPMAFDGLHGTGIQYLTAFDYQTAVWAKFVSVTVTSQVVVVNRVLTASVLTVRVSSSVIIYGNAFTPNQWVYLVWQRPDWTWGSTWVFTSVTGTFSFTLGFLPTCGCGKQTIWAYDYGSSLFSSPLVVTVTP